ncbi:MAG: MBL fold metallo-hydrolase [Anaerolineales bacterium]|nr:MBL fold metallo-hydrolase [Anaerolineales bacterium]
MPIDTRGKLCVYCLNVGQGDTSVILTPGNRIMLVDAYKEKKIIDLLNRLGFDLHSDRIEQIIVTHPHNDHYGAVEALLNTCQVGELTLSSLWRFEADTPGYNNLINTAVSKSIPLNFVSGYTQLFPDNSPVQDANALRLECLGPSNQLIEALYQAGDLITNHRSIITRLQFGKFRMVIAADAQMENWAHFDQEQMLNASCTVLRSAHHGSANGTQFERLERLSPRLVIVSSDPNGKDDLPDLIGSAIFMRYATASSKPIVALTHNTGTIKIEVAPSGDYEAIFYGEGNLASNLVPLANSQPLTRDSNPSNWKALALVKFPA